MKQIIEAGLLGNILLVVWAATHLPVILLLLLAIGAGALGTFKLSTRKQKDQSEKS